MTLQDIVLDARNCGFKGNISHMNRLADKVNKRPDKVYDLMAEYGIYHDSIIREKLFQYLADKYHKGNYDKLYKRWLQAA